METAYQDLLIEYRDRNMDEAIDYLYTTLPAIWIKEYQHHCNRITDICFITSNSFEYIFDDSMGLEADGKISTDLKTESRVVAAFGISVQLDRLRDDYRLPSRRLNLCREKK